MSTLNSLSAAVSQSANKVYDRPVRTEFKLLAKIRIHEPQKALAEIAREMGYSYQTILCWLKNMEYQRYESWLLDVEFEELPRDVQAVRERVREKYGLFSEEMQDRLYTILETTKDEKLQASVAQDFLDRAGFQPPKSSGERNFVVTLTQEMFDTLERRAREAKLLNSSPLTPHPEASVRDDCGDGEPLGEP